MRSDFEISVDDEINMVFMERPHVVLIGAGASRAAFPVGEANGKKLPLMGDFLDVVPIRQILENTGVSTEPENFEEIYNSIATDPAKADIRKQLEGIVYSYFDSLELPETHTLYDHLLLSLRAKDVIATFNWDPFLIRAARRNKILSGRLPNIVFLHGNVLAGFCPRDSVWGVKGVRCSRCGQLFEPSRLLYPIRDKDYHQNQMIAGAWDYLHWALENTFMLTIFGYSSPVTDVSAVDLLKGAWGGSKKRHLEIVEIIDIVSEDSLLEKWKHFIHTHHYEVHTSFYDSWIARHPRRTGEAYRTQYIDAKFINDNPMPYKVGFKELWDWHERLIGVERQHKEKK